MRRRPAQSQKTLVFGIAGALTTRSICCDALLVSRKPDCSNIPQCDDDGNLLARWLRDSQGYVRLTTSSISKVGSASRTFGAILELADRNTMMCYASIVKIEALVHLPRHTVQRHLWKLEQARLVKIIRRRRAVSRFEISKEEWVARVKYLALPKWWTDTKWSTTVTFAYLLSNLCMVEEFEESQAGCFDSIRCIRPADVGRHTGLSLRSVRRALRDLEHSGRIACDDWEVSGVFEYMFPPQPTASMGSGKDRPEKVRVGRTAHQCGQDGTSTDGQNGTSKRTEWHRVPIPSSPDIPECIPK
jgi:hypothetical protein